MTKNTTTTNKIPSTGVLLSNYIAKKRIPQAALARALGIQPTSVINYKKGSSIQTKQLWKISQILKYNFFMDIAQMLPDTYRTGTDIFEEHNKEIAQLEQQIAILQAEKAVLLESRK